MVEGLIRFDGADADSYLFSTTSWTGSGEEYVIEISKRDGMVRCTCADASYRRKSDRVDAKEPRLCKHAQAVLRWAKQLTGEQT